MSIAEQCGDPQGFTSHQTNANTILIANNFVAAEHSRPKTETNIIFHVVVLFHSVLASSSFLFLVVMPGATSSVLAPSSDASLLLVAMPFVESRSLKSFCRQMSMPHQSLPRLHGKPELIHSFGTESEEYLVGTESKLSRNSFC